MANAYYARTMFLSAEGDIPGLARVVTTMGDVGGYVSLEPVTRSAVSVAALSSTDIVNLAELAIGLFDDGDISQLEDVVKRAKARVATLERKS